MSHKSKKNIELPKVVKSDKEQTDDMLDEIYRHIEAAEDADDKLVNEARALLESIKPKEISETSPVQTVQTAQTVVSQGANAVQNTEGVTPSHPLSDEQNLAAFAQLFLPTAAPPKPAWYESIPKKVWIAIAVLLGIALIVAVWLYFSKWQKAKSKGQKAIDKGQGAKGNEQIAMTTNPSVNESLQTVNEVIVPPTVVEIPKIEVSPTIVETPKINVENLF